MTAIETTASTYVIPVDHIDEFKAEIAKLNRNAVKLGSDPITFVVGQKKIVERTFYFGEHHEQSKKYKVEAVDVVLTGTAPKLEGYLFIARIEYLSDSKSVLFHTVPGSNVKIDERFRGLDASVCEHCNMKRRRNDTFVVQEVATGKQTQVGRQCLADFTGINDPTKAAMKAASLSVFEKLYDSEERFWGRVREDTIDTLEALSLTSAYICKFGWVPKSQSEFNHPTASYVEEHFAPWASNRSEDVAFRKEMRALSEEQVHQDRATKVVEWIKNELFTTAKSDYELNLVTLTVNELTQRRHLGIVCSAVAAYQRAMNQKVEYAGLREVSKASKFFATVGERVRSIKVKVQFVKSFEGSFGPTTLVKFVTEDGNILTWFASGDRDYEAGQEVVIDGTVKSHKAYQGIEETQMTRCKAK